MTDQLVDDEREERSEEFLIADEPLVDAAHEPSGPAWWRRAGSRAVRRPRRWIEAPWTTERIVQTFTALILVGVSTWAAVQVIHPDLVLTNNTPAGGDMGAHVMGPAYLRDVFIREFQLSGWSNYWYAGFPLYRFYMVIPALAIVALNVVLPYGIAFKIVVVAGIVTLPLACWAFGRLARFRYPMPELFAIGGILFLFDESFSIYGGNVKSTMAGEFSFSIALSLAMLGLGLFARGLETGKYRNWTAIVLALACLSHGIVLIFVAFGALLMWLVWMDRRRFLYGLSVGVTAFLLAAFWVVPFLFDHEYMTDMKYGFRPSGTEDSFWDMFFPLTTFFDILITTFAVIGFVASVARRHLNGAWMGLCALALVAGVYVTRDSLPVIGLLWNPRLLPFLYLLRYLLMMVGIVETALFLVRGIRGVGTLSPRATLTTGAVTAAVVAVSVLMIELMFFRVMPGAGFQTHNGKTVYQWGPISLTATSTDALSDAWPRYNFSGYEDKAAYGEYHGLVQTMAGLGDDPDHGCGRALWENNGANGVYGTTMALMLLPHWTDGCIASMEGLFFEASGTTPYHFLTAAAMSQNASNPVRELRYVNNDAEIGVDHLQALGVKYTMVFTEAAKAEADTQPELTLVATSGPWNVYEVADSDLVVPLTVQPVVVADRPGDQRERHLELGTSWFQHTDEWAAIPADDGPDAWQRITVSPDPARLEDRRVDIVVPDQPIETVEMPEVTVSDVRLGDQDLRFRVDQIGVPVLVRMSYFPNWDVDGAEGPYRVAPNLMVVIPTETEVHLTYGRTPLDWTAYGMTLLGLALLPLWRRRGDARFPDTDPSADPSATVAVLDDDAAPVLAPVAATLYDDELTVDDTALLPVDDLVPWPPDDEFTGPVGPTAPEVPAAAADEQVRSDPDGHERETLGDPSVEHPDGSGDPPDRL